MAVTLSRVRRVALLGAALAVAAGTAVAIAQAPAARRPAAASARPDLNGIWQAFTTANWDIQDHSAKKKQNYEKRFTDDPEAKCFMPGVPRATYMPYPFQIQQTADYILIAYQFAGAVRTIHMGTREPNPEDFAIPSWMGYSRGRWEGRTLVVEAAHFNDKTWFDRAGNHHSEALKVTERYTPVSADHLDYEATIEDAQVFSRPWTLKVTLYRSKNPAMQLMNFKCVEFAEEMIYGHLYKKAD
jgi:hypothetical protein